MVEEPQTTTGVNAYDNGTFIVVEETDFSK
jgi:hypothetical protein